MNVKRTILAVILASSMAIGLVGCSSIDNFLKKDSTKVEKNTSTDTAKEDSATESKKEPVVDSTKTDSKTPEKEKPVVDNSKTDSKTETKTLNVGMFIPNGSYNVKFECTDTGFNTDFIKGDGKSYEAIGTTGKGPSINVYSVKNAALTKVFSGDLTEKELKDKENIDYLSKGDKSKEVVMLKEPLKVGTRWDNKEIVEVGENLKLDKITLKGPYVKTWEQVTSNGVKTVKVFYFSEGLGCVKYDVIVDGVSMEKSTITSVTKK